MHINMHINAYKPFSAKSGLSIVLIFNPLEKQKITLHLLHYLQKVTSLERAKEKCRRREAITVTIDFSCLDKGGERKDMRKLRILSERGLIEMKGTEHMDKEFYEESPATVRAKLRRQLEFFEKLYPEDPAIIGKMRIGRFRIGGEGTVREGKDVFDFFQEFKPLMFPNFDGLSETNQKRDIQDIMHLSIHYVFKRDIFVTRNIRHFRTEALTRRFPNLVILTPKELVDFMKDCA
jgi:hypothetical protein